MVTQGSPTARRRRLGSLLRSAREAKALSREDAAAHLQVTPGAIGRWENGSNGVQHSTLRMLMELYDITDEVTRAEWETLAREGKRRGWWAPYSGMMRPSFGTYVGLEADAVGVDYFSAVVVPGLLQTADYARATFAQAVPALDPATVDARVRVRMQRQAILTRTDNPVVLHAVLDEACIRRKVGGIEIWAAQMKHLLAMAERHNVTIQVLPFEGGAHASVLGSFIVLSFADGPAIAYIEQAAGDLFAEGPQGAVYETMFNGLRAQALSPGMSADLIRSALV